MGTATPTGPSPLRGSGVPIKSTQPTMVDQMADDIKTRPAVEQPEGEMYTISVQVEEVVLMMKEVASMEGDGLPYMMVETVKCGVAYMVAHMASR